MEEIESIRFCLHCGNQAPHKVLLVKEFVSDYAEQDDGIEFPIAFGIDYVLECKTCSRLSLYENEYCDTTDVKNSFYQSKVVWPTTKLDLESSEIPKSVLQIYAEAYKVKFIAPNAFVVLIRRALEAICINQGISGKKSLHEGLKQLTSLGKLPTLLSEVSNVIKTIGNAGAHAVGPPIYKFHISTIDDFFRVVVEYLYIAPSKLEKFKQEAEKFKF